MRACVLLSLGLSVLVLGQATNDPVKPDKPLLVFDSGGHTGRVWAVMFTADGKQLVSVAEDKTIRVWDVDSGSSVRVLRPPIGPELQGALYGGALSPDGKTLAVAGYGFTTGNIPIYLIDFETGEIKETLIGHSQTINCLAFSPDGKLLASAGHDKAVRVWTIGTNQCVVMNGHTGPIYAITFAADSKRIATASNDGTARIWNFAVSAEERVLQGIASTPRSIAWSPDGFTIATGCLDQSIVLSNPRGERIGIFQNLGHEILAVRFTADSKNLLLARGAGNSSQDLSLMSVATGQMSWTFVGSDNVCHSVAINPKRPIAAVASVTGEIHLVSMDKGTKLARLGSPSKVVQGVGWSGDGKSLAWGTKFQGVNQHPLQRAFHLLKHELSENPGGDFRGAKTVVAGSRIEKNSATQLRVVSNGRADVFINLRLAGDTIQSFSFLDEGRVVVGSNFNLDMFDARSGAFLSHFKGHVGTVNGVAASPDGKYFATSSADHTVRVWRPDRETPLLSMFFVGNEWIVWTGDGYYATSVGGEHMMGWLLSRGQDRMGIYCPSAQVRKKLYRPELIKLIFTTGDLQRALDELERLTRREEPPTSILKVLPPIVTIATPGKNPLDVDEDVFDLTAEAQSVGEHPVTSMHVILDDRPVTEGDAIKLVNPPQSGKVKMTWKLKMPAGEHSVVVQADSPVSKGVSMPLVIRRVSRGFKGKPPVPVPALPPGLFVLSVGISDYKGNLKLDYAANDAKVFEQTIVTHGKPLFKNVKSRPLLDKEASREGIIDGLKWLKSEAKEHDICVVFFAGHGKHEPDSGYYFLPYDVDAKKIAVTGFPGTELMAFLKKMPANRILLILDTCDAGALVGGDKARSVPEEVIRDLATTDYGIVVMAAGMAGEQAFENKDFKHGYYTQALIEGLEGKAANPQGVVYLADLDGYVTDRVKTLTKGLQHPVIHRPIRSIPLTAPKLIKKAG